MISKIEEQEGNNQNNVDSHADYIYICICVFFMKFQLKDRKRIDYIGISVGFNCYAAIYTNPDNR